MSAFFRLWELAVKKDRMLVLQAGWRTVTDYTITVIERKHIEDLGSIVFCESGVTIELAASRAYVKLDEYLCKAYGGY